MKHDRWREVDELFAAALERQPSERAAFLDEACGNDRNLRAEVEKMLSFSEQATEFIETDIFEVAAQLISKQPEPAQKINSFIQFKLDRQREIHSGRCPLGSLSYRRTTRPGTRATTYLR